MNGRRVAGAASARSISLRPHRGLRSRYVVVLTTTKDSVAQPPELQRLVAKRMSAKTYEADASHVRHELVLEQCVWCEMSAREIQGVSTAGHGVP